MIPIWKPLTRITITESTSSLIKPGAMGFVVLLSDDSQGYRNYWNIDLMLTRNGKKGQRHIFYRRTRTKKLEYSDFYKPDVVEVIKKDLIYARCYEPGNHRNVEYVTLESDPYKSRDLLDWDPWDYLGWLAAVSQLCSFMADFNNTKRRLRDGLPLIGRPGVQPIVIGPEGIDILQIDIDKLIGLLLYFPADKQIINALKKAFSDKGVRTILIEKARRALAYGQSTYKDLMNETTKIYDEFVGDLSENVTYELNPDLKAKKAQPDKLTKKVWNTRSNRYTSPTGRGIRIPELRIETGQELVNSIISGNSSYTIDVSTVGGGTTVITMSEPPPLVIGDQSPTPTRIVEVDTPTPVINQSPVEQHEAEPAIEEFEEFEEDDAEYMLDDDSVTGDDIQDLIREMRAKKIASNGESNDNNR